MYLIYIIDQIHQLFNESKSKFKKEQRLNYRLKAKFIPSVTYMKQVHPPSDEVQPQKN
jgi:hypothetical protein